MIGKLIIGVLVMSGMLSLCVDSQVVFGGGEGTTTSYCELDGKTESVCNTCYGGNSGVSQSAANNRCTAQVSGVCDQFSEFSSAKQAGSWLLCISDVRDGPQGNTYTHLWVAASDVWRYFPPYVNPDYNLFAGNGEVNCTCNLATLNPTSSQQSSNIYGSATSYERFGNEAVVHVGYRNVKNTWVEVQQATAQNILVRSPRNGNPSFTDPTGWERVAGQSTPGRPPRTFAPGPYAYYYGWTAHLTSVSSYYWAWLIDGVLVCLDIESGCDGRVEIPLTPPESQLAGHCALAEHSRSNQGDDSIQYSFDRCVGGPKPRTWVFPGRASSPDCASTSLSGLDNIDSPANNIVVNQNDACYNIFVSSIGSGIAVTAAISNKNKDFGVSVTFLAGHTATVRPAYNGIIMENGHCAGWRGPAYQCDVCASAYSQCGAGRDDDGDGSSDGSDDGSSDGSDDGSSDGSDDGSSDGSDDGSSDGSDDDGDHGTGKWIDPDQQCQCVPCTGDSKLVCYGNTEWDTKSCRCVACTPSKPPPCDSTKCYYNKADPCASGFAECSIVNCPEGVNNKAGAAGFPRRCNQCETCFNNAATLCPGSLQEVPTHTFSFDLNSETCDCLECGVDYIPTCKADPIQNDNAHDETGSLYYNSSLNKCGCTNCNIHWSDTSYFPVTRQPDGSCSQINYAAGSGTCARCYECGTCPPGYAVAY